MKSETDWFYKAKWGVFCHYLADEASTAIQTQLTAEQWNKRIDEFDVDGLAAQLASAGAKYFCITLGQNSGFYIAPNSTYDDLVGILPSKLSNRDLISDLAVALAPFGISLMVYFTGSAPANEPQAIKKLKCTPPWDARLLGLNPDIYSSEEAEQTDDRLSKFQQYWEAIIREWSLRWGGKSGRQTWRGRCRRRPAARCGARGTCAPPP